MAVFSIIKQHIQHHVQPRMLFPEIFGIMWYPTSGEHVCHGCLNIRSGNRRLSSSDSVSVCWNAPLQFHTIRETLISPNVTWPLSFLMAIRWWFQEVRRGSRWQIQSSSVQHHGHLLALSFLLSPSFPLAWLSGWAGSTNARQLRVLDLAGNSFLIKIHDASARGRG